MADGLFEQIKKNTKEQLPSEWASYLKPGTAQYEAAVLLNAQGKLPKISKGSLSDSGNNAEFDPSTNTVTVNPNLKPYEIPQGLAHELTHALTTVMQATARSILNNRDKTQPSAADKNFMDAWYKLDPDNSKLATFRYPDAEYNQYRSSFREAPAWAVGRMEDPRQSLTRTEYWMSSPGGSHVDATLAQEQAILRDLQARRLQPQPQPATPWYKDPFGFTIK